MSAPEKIWIEDEFGEGHEDQWQYGSWDCRNAYDYVHEYTRADIADAAVAAAYEAAAVEMDLGAHVVSNCGIDEETQAYTNAARIIRALTPNDAKAALEAVRREALKDAAEQLMQMHREHMAYLERDPDNYVSAYYTASIELRALIDKPTQEKSDA